MQLVIGTIAAFAITGLYALYGKTPSEINPDAAATSQVSVPPWTSTSTSMSVIGTDALVSHSAIESLVNKLVLAKERDSKSIQVTKQLS